MSESAPTRTSDAPTTEVIDDGLAHLLLDSTGEGIYGIDLEGNCTFANRACVRLLGFDTDGDLLGRHMHNLVHHTRPNGEPYPQEECRIYQAFRQNAGTHVDDEVMFRRDGSSFPAEYWSFPVERDGELVGCVLTFVDITDRRQAEQELREAERMAALGKLSAGLAHELNNPAAAAGRASGQLLEALDELQSATVALTGAGIPTDLAASLNDWYHELRRRTTRPTGLSALEESDREEALSAWLEAHGVEDSWAMASTFAAAGIRSEDLDALAVTLPTDPVAMAWLCKALAAKELADVVVQSSRSISALVDVVKSYSYMDQAPVQCVDVHDGIEDTLTILGHKLGDGITTVREYDRELPEIEVHGSELNQVWTNIIDNAIDALGDDGTITLRTYRDGDQIAVAIEDDGPGIPDDIQARVLDPFFTTKAVGQGTGLGLDVARRIVCDRCGGRLNFRSRPGETVFTVRLPVG